MVKLCAIALELLGADPAGQATSGGAGLEVEGNFQPYIFWAYAAVCVLLFLFFVLCIRQSRKLAERIGYLEERVARAIEQKPESRAS